MRTEGVLALLGRHAVAFREAEHLIFHRDQQLAAHPNGMRFSAWNAAGDVIAREDYYSIGGGFVIREGEIAGVDERGAVRYPFHSGADLLHLCDENGLSIWQLMLENEKAWRSEREIRQGIELIWRAMQDCVQRGLTIEGILPGGLKVRRRAPKLYRRLATAGENALSTMDWLNVYAMAANEEMTAPTNGAAGVIPAVAHYYVNRMNGNGEGIERYFLTAAAIGVLYKENASISGAEVGCQGEVGVACSMAAGGLVAAQEGTNEQIEHAAEIAMEHNLGMTCDPIGGLVQIPCIERNAFGAVKAVNAARMAVQDTGDHKVSLDQVIRTMFQTGLDMQSKYKETSLAGLAVNVIEC